MNCLVNTRLFAGYCTAVNNVRHCFLCNNILYICFSGERVEGNLDKYLQQAEGLLRAGNPDTEEHYIELCLMVIQCLEVNCSVLCFSSQTAGFQQATKLNINLLIINKSVINVSPRGRTGVGGGGGEGEGSRITPGN